MFGSFMAFQTGARRRAPACLPGVDRLESRELLAKVANVPAAFLFTPIPEGTILTEHIHSFLTINVNGQDVAIPKGIGLGPGGNLPIHTHDSSGILHVESTQAQPFRLRDFFTIWGQPFDKKHILGFTADKTHKVAMSVNGRPSQAFGSVLLKDLEDIVIRYQTVGRGGQSRP